MSARKLTDTDGELSSIRWVKRLSEVKVPQREVKQRDSVRGVSELEYVA